MAINFLPNPVYRFKDLNDNPLVGGLVFTYDTGTTDKQTTWKDKAKVAQHTNPIILDSRGEAEIWYDGTLDLVPAPVGDTDPPSSPLDTVIGLQSSIDASVITQSGLVPNQSFESSATELTNWTATPAGSSTIEVSTFDPVDGSNSVKFTAGAGGGGKLISEFISITEASILVVNGMVKSDGVGLTNDVKIAFYDKDKIATSTDTSYTNGGVSLTTWAEFYGESTAPVNSVWCKVELHGSSGGAGSTWFDAIHLDLAKQTYFSLLDPQRGMSVNSIFEHGEGSLRGWDPSPSATSTISTSSIVSVTGSRSLQFVSVDATGAGTVDSRFIPVTGGHRIAVEAMVISSATNLTNLISLRYYDEDKAFLSTVVIYTNGGVSSTTFERIIGQVTVTNGARYVKIRLTGSSNSAGTVNFDRVHVTDEMDDSLKFCHVATVTTQGITPSTTTTVNWGAEITDIWGMHDNSTNSSRINIPDWCKFARFTYNMKMGVTATATDIQARIISSPSAPNRAEKTFRVSAGEAPSFSLVTPWVNASGVDYFYCTIWHNDSGNINVEQTSSLHALGFMGEFKAK